MLLPASQPSYAKNTLEAKKEIFGRNWLLWWVDIFPPEWSRCIMARRMARCVPSTKKTLSVEPMVKQKRNGIPVKTA
jgi:hypothetical protein